MRTRLTCFVTLGLALPVNADDELNAAILDRVKAATVFVKSDNNGSSRSGSGFLFAADGDTGLVVTNEHVVANPPGKDLPPTRFTVTFRSGKKGEAVTDGTIVAVDKERDVAILRVRGVKDLPSPLNVERKDELRETMTVFAAGYPFGAALSVSNGSPAVSVSRASISSLRHDKNSELVRIELEGSLHPGNSGGPVVDKDGQLVGIVVARVSGSNIGIAVPSASLSGMLEGRTGRIGWHVHKVTSGVAEVEISVSLVDPLSKIGSVSVRVAKNDSFDEFRQDKNGKWAALPGAQTVELKINDQVATGTIALKSTKPVVTYYSVQPVFARSDKILINARPSEPLRVDFRANTAANLPTAPFRSDMITVTPKASGDWIYKAAERGSRLFTDANYILAELPDEIVGGTLVVRKSAERNAWLEPHNFEAIADGTVYVLFRVKHKGKEEVSEVVTTKLEREGWTEVNGAVETTFPDGEDWRWAALRQKVKKGSVVLQLKTVGWPNAPVLFVFKKDK